MSRVIGFRLDPKNPREAEALAILESRREEGYSTRQILLEALLNLDAETNTQTVSAQLDDITAILNAVNQQVSRLQATPRLTENGKESDLSAAFVQSVKNAAKSGIKLQE